MDLEKATPQAISDYKQSWMSRAAWPVRLHSDLDVQGKDWCRRNMERWQWSFKKYTNVYEHTFFFEHKCDAEEFAEAMPSEFINQ